MIQIPIDISIYSIVRSIFQVYYIILVTRVILSWVRPGFNGLIGRFVYDMTEPVLALCRRLIPIQGMRIDFSPIIALILLQIAENLILRLILSL